MFNQDLDWARLGADFAADRRVQITNALPADQAERLRAHLLTLPYALMTTRGGHPTALMPETLGAMNATARTMLQREIEDAAARGLGFLYDGHQAGGSDDPTLRDFLDSLNAPATLDRMRRLVADDEITRADGQATRYRPGHFLTRHLDDPAGEGRRLAYVLSLTKNWHPDWGGLLQFYERDGTPRDAWAPVFNTLSVFDVTHIHAVTFVTPFARAPRLSITGWFRTR